MNTALFIAKRYLFAKKSTNAINVISAISGLGIIVGSAALIIILSVFNGFEKMVLKTFNSVTPSLLIEPIEGKTFNPNTKIFDDLKLDKRISSYTEVLAENALVRYDEKQTPALVKGVSDDFLLNKDLDSILVEGSFVLENRFKKPQAVLGSALQAFLNANIADPFVQLNIFFAKKGRESSSINPLDDFSVLNIPPIGVFEVQQDFDNILFVPLSAMRQVLNEPINISSIEINIANNADSEALKLELKDLLGSQFTVKNRIEQNQALYNVLSSEKWIVYFILTFILIIAIFNIIGSLTMLVIDKQKDISILSSIGADKKLIKQIFLAEGMLISIAGCIFGLIIGLIVCLLQLQFGWITMGDANFLVSNAYPIALKWEDFILVFITVGFISLVATTLAANLSVKKLEFINQNL